MKTTRIEVSGTIESLKTSTWLKDCNNIWDAGKIIKYEKNLDNSGKAARSSGTDGPPLPPESDQRSEFDHKGGPF